jgi:hypothetical protein
MPTFIRNLIMTTYVLFLYLSTGILQNATGGPAVVDGFKSLEKCEAANQAAKEQLPKYDWGKCLKVDK